MTPKQKQAEALNKLAGSEKLLNPHGDFLLIDMLASKYKQYTHDDIYNMPLPLVEELIIVNKKQAFINSKAEEINKSLNE